jgi:hypothetical protein
MPVHVSFVDTLEKVANLAVKKIGERKTIADLDTDIGTVAETVRAFIYQVMREVQSEFRWGELTASVELEVPMSEADGTYQYTLPSDFLRPASNRDQSYVIENGYLFTDVSENFSFRYIRYSENPAEWSGLLVKCIYFRLAMEICLPITENIQRYNGLLEEYEKVVFPRAQKIGSFDQENPVSRRAHGSYSRTRGGLGASLATAFNRVIGVPAPGHNHDADYSAIDHLHDDRYSLLGHDHDDLYPTLAVFDAHDHDDRYSLLGHDHAGVYSVVSHTHGDLIPNIQQSMLTTTYAVTGGAIPNWQNTGLEVTITPRYANSKIRVRAVINGSTSNNTVPMLLRVTRGGTVIALAASPGSRIECHGQIAGPTDVNEMECCSIDFMTDAGNTDATVIRIQACILHATYTGTINASRTDTDSTSYSRTISNLIVEEVFQA